MPRTRSKRRRPVQKRDMTPRVLSREEKRELILAHAANRKPMHPRDKMTLWGSVIICAVAIAAAWIAVVPSGIRRIMAAPSDASGMRDVRTAGEELRDEIAGVVDGAGMELQDGFAEIDAMLQIEAEKENARQALRNVFLSAAASPAHTAVTGTEASAPDATTTTRTE